jgi:CHAT domain-containing protein
VSLYRRLVAGASPAGALRETKLEFARSRGPWSQPRHWAPYVLYGAQ